MHLLNCDSEKFVFGFVVDQCKEAAFKVAPSKWEAVDESELSSQGETSRWQINQLSCKNTLQLNSSCIDGMIVMHVKLYLPRCCFLIASLLLLSCDDLKMGGAGADRTNKKVSCVFALCG